MIDNLTATAAAEHETPPQRPDFEGQNVEQVRFFIASNIRDLIERLNREMKDARTAGLTVSVYHGGVLGGADASVSIYEDRRY